MARENLSAEALEAMFSQQTNEVFIALLEIDEAQLPTPIRVANNTQDVVRSGVTYLAARFALAIPSEEDGTIRSVELVIDNVSRIIGRAIDLATERPTASLMYVLASDPDADPPEAGPFEFVFETASYDAATARASLRFTDAVHQRYPEHGYLPSFYPGLF